MEQRCGDGLNYPIVGKEKTRIGDDIAEFQINGKAELATMTESERM